MKINQQIRGYFAEIGRKGGKAISEAKTQAARENAKKGGWPKGRPRKVNKP
jgi:general stress protein YciG